MNIVARRFRSWTVITAAASVPITIARRKGHRHPVLETVVSAASAGTMISLWLGRDDGRRLADTDGEPVYVAALATLACLVPLSIIHRRRRVA